MMNGDVPTSRRYDLSILDFVVPEHVRDRWEERVGHRPSHEDIRQEVFEAIWRGRWSLERPEWLGAGARRAAGDARFAWPEHREYAYVVIVGTPRPEVIHVKTLLTPHVENSGLRDALKRWLRANRGEDAA
jgi:hypothetical protein